MKLRPSNFDILVEFLIYFQHILVWNDQWLSESAHPYLGYSLLMICAIIQFNCHRSLDNFNIDLIWRSFCSQGLFRLVYIN